MKPKITWQEATWGIMDGFAGGLKVFSLDTGASPLRLTARIGTEKILKPKLKTVEEAKAYAAAYLKAFLEKIEYEN